ncbi:serine carboxypeptidase-like 35, partial [Quercus suber]
MLQSPMAVVWSLLLCCLVSTLLVVSAEEIHGEEAEKEADRVKNLPGQPADLAAHPLHWNAVINDATDLSGMFEYSWSHAIISDKLYNDIVKECDFRSDNQTRNCGIHIRGFLEAYSAIDIYNIYAPICLTSLSRTSPKLVVAPRLITQHRALHANVTKLPYPYTTCSGVISGWNDSADTVLPIIRKLLNAGLRIWIYRLGADVRGGPNISHSERRRASGPSLCSSSIPFSLHPFPLFQNLAGFSILDAAKEDNI